MTTASITTSHLRAVEAAKREHEAERRRNALATYGGRVLFGVTVLVAWQTLSGVVLDLFFFSRPTAVWASLVEIVRNGQFERHVGLTVQEAVLGYLAGAAVAIVLGAALGLFPRAYAIFEPFILGVYSVPSVAIAPLLIVWFGIGLTPKILLAGYFVFFVVFMNLIAGIRGVPQGWIDVVRVMGADRLQVTTKVTLRAAAPYLLTGLRTALPQAVIGAIVAEFISSQRGIGFLISNASARYDTAGVFAAILILSVLVLVMAAVLNVRWPFAAVRRA